MSGQALALADIKPLGECDHSGAMGMAMGKVIYFFFFFVLGRE